MEIYFVSQSTAGNQKRKSRTKDPCAVFFLIGERV